MTLLASGISTGSSSIFWPVLGTLLTLMIIGAGSVGTWAALRVGRNAQTLTNYKDTAESWRQRSEVQESHIKDQDTRINELETQIGSLAAANAELRGKYDGLKDLVTGTSAIQQLREETVSRYTVLEHMITTRFDEIAAALQAGS